MKKLSRGDNLVRCDEKVDKEKRARMQNVRGEGEKGRQRDDKPKLLITGRKGKGMKDALRRIGKERRSQGRDLDRKGPSLIRKQESRKGNNNGRV